jgi:hypothetical protein
MAAKTECFHGGCCVRIYPSRTIWKKIPFADNICVLRLEKAAADPETLTQDAIIDNLNPEEHARLSKVRNIGIAVRIQIQAMEYLFRLSHSFGNFI